MNFLEQLVAEWYEYRGYFVRRNVLVGRLARGGHECELDVVAFHPEKKHLVHVEPSTDANSFEQRDRRFAKKFAAGRKYIPKLFAGLRLPDEIDQYSVVINGNRTARPNIGGRPFKLQRELLIEILRDVKDIRSETNAIPENFPLLRLLQMISKHREAVINVLAERSPVA